MMQPAQDRARGDTTDLSLLKILKALKSLAI